MISKVIGIVLILVLSLIAGSVLALSAIADMIELSSPMAAPKPRIRLTSDLKAVNSNGIPFNGEHEALQPALGYRKIQVTDELIQYTIRGY